MRRWVTERTKKSIEHEELQLVVIYAEENKEQVKREHKGYSYTRLLLVPKKEQSTPRYIISKISRV